MNREAVKALLASKTLLLVEDDIVLLEAWKSLLVRYFSTIITATNGEEGLEAYKNEKIDLILSDLTMPKMGGIEMAQAIITLNPSMPIIFLTGHNETQYIQQMEYFGGHYVIKPLNKEDILLKICQVLA